MLTDIRPAHTAATPPPALGLGEHQTLVMAGLSFRTAAVAVREKVAFGPGRLPATLQHIAAHPLVDEVVILSTCNRTELYAVLHDAEDWQAVITAILAEQSDATAAELADSLYCYTGEDAARHLFRVAAGLDSMVLGEGEIVCQLKQAITVAREQETADTILQRLIEKALAASKRARTQAGYEAGGLSVASYAVAACKQACPELAITNVLVLGAGETAELTLHYLVSKGVRNVLVANRTVERAEQLARLVGGEALSLEQFASRVREVDLIICCTASPHPVLTVEKVAPAMVGREQRPLLIIDIAVPRDVAPEVADIPGVRLVNIDQLQQTMTDGVEQRRAKLVAAEHIIGEEAHAFGKWLSMRRAIAIVTELRQQLETLRAETAESLARELCLSTREERRIIEEHTQGLMRGILREAVCTMQAFTGADAASPQMELVRRILEKE